MKSSLVLSLLICSTLVGQTIDEAKICENVVENDCINPLEFFQTGDKVYCWIKVSGAQVGSSIFVEWINNDELKHKNELKMTYAAMRTYSYKTLHTPGAWRADIKSADGKLLKSLSLKAEGSLVEKKKIEVTRSQLPKGDLFKELKMWINVPNVFKHSANEREPTSGFETGDYHNVFKISIGDASYEIWKDGENLLLWKSGNNEPQRVTIFYRVDKQKVIGKCEIAYSAKSETSKPWPFLSRDFVAQKRNVSAPLGDKPVPSIYHSDQADISDVAVSFGESSLFVIWSFKNGREEIQEARKIGADEAKNLLQHAGHSNVTYYRYEYSSGGDDIKGTLIVADDVSNITEVEENSDGKLTIHKWSRAVLQPN